MFVRGRKIRAVCIIAIAMIGAMVAGCASHSKTSHDTTASKINEPITADRVPASAKRQASGDGQQTFRAKTHGRVWLFDDDRKAVLYSALLEKGDRLTVAPRLHRATLNGEDIGVNDIFERNTHAIYFLALNK